MATVLKARKAKSTRSTSAPPALPVAWPVEKSRHEEQQEYFPKVGDDVFVYLNSNPFWEKPSWGVVVVDVSVRKIRDLMAEPLLFDEFAKLVTANIGRYLIDCDWTIHYEEPLRGACQFFWNDCLVDTYWDATQADPDTGHCDFQLEPDSPAQPYQQHALEIVARVGQAWVPMAKFGTDAEDRLLMFAQLRDLAAKTQDTTALGVRPVGC